MSIDIGEILREGAREEQRKDVCMSMQGSVSLAGDRSVLSKNGDMLRHKGGYLGFEGENSRCYTGPRTYLSRASSTRSRRTCRCESISEAASTLPRNVAKTASNSRRDMVSVLKVAVDCLVSRP